MRGLIQRYNPIVFLAMALALAYHGALLLSGTYKGTYDAYVHIFFADHYARAWFDHWEPRWYTGFAMTSYPPGSQQTIALLSHVVGLQNGFVMVMTFAVLNCTLGMYRFAKVWVSDEAAGYASFLLVFASCIAETVHVFGQLPTMFSLGFLLNALPFVYRWIREGRVKWLISAWALNAATTAGHHVTTLFGAVFFVGPVILLAVVESLRVPLSDESPEDPALVTRNNFWPLVIRRVRRMLPSLRRAAIYGPGLIAALLLVVLPYWLWSKSDPITQVSIPHASRDSFIKNTAAGLVFWLIPYGLTLLTLPYVFYKGLTTRAWPMALSLLVLVVLGTGGTTPLPRMLLRGAFDVLTLDRFTFWACITQLPLLGEFVVSLRHGRLARYAQEQLGHLAWRLAQVSLVLTYLMCSVVVANFTKFRRFQPDPIDFQPIVTFLEKDQHWRWRFLTLGLGDQMAWLSAQTTAGSVDGNYHSARRLPELTTTPVERLEGAKYSGIPGIGSLQQFIAVPDKYNLKFIFSNDQFYDPVLYFSGWHRLRRLENGIMVWEREDIPPLPEVLPRKEIPYYQRIMWGVVPMAALVAAMAALLSSIWWPYLLWLVDLDDGFGITTRLHVRRRFYWALGWPVRWTVARAPRAFGVINPARMAVALGRALDERLRRAAMLPKGDESPRARWQVWRDWIARLPRPRPAAPTAHHVRLAMILLGITLTTLVIVRHRLAVAHTPRAVVEAYFDDLDFRRFNSAYERLDPRTRAPYDQFLLELSVRGGIVASYGKLDSVRVSTLKSAEDEVTMVADTDWVTSLAVYKTSQKVTLGKFAGEWRIEPDVVDITVPPEQFLRRAEVSWASSGRRRVSTKTTSFGDVLDRPELQVLSARLVKVRDRYSVVGELINVDSDPGDLTVTALLNGPDGRELTRYNAQQVIIHKLLPKEVTPFRVDFEGVAGAAITSRFNSTKFAPDAFTAPELGQPVRSFDVYAKAVITPYDLGRDIATQNITLSVGDDGRARLSGQLLNIGTREATIPHVLITYYDESNRVIWVDHAFMREAVRPQRTQPFNIVVTPYDEVQVVVDKGELFANNLDKEILFDSSWRERLVFPQIKGYASLRLSVHYFTGSSQ